MSRKPRISNPVIEPSSTILVTGANGLVGSHCVNQAIAVGYMVRATVREIERTKWLVSHFEEKYGKACIELFEVPDVYLENYLDEAVKGVSSIIHTVLIHFDFMTTSAETSVAKEIKTVLEALKSASKEPSVRTFVLTTSVWTTHLCWVQGPYVLKPNTWNDQSITRAYDESYQEGDKGIRIFQASKARMEQQAWKCFGTHYRWQKLETEYYWSLVQAFYEGGSEMATGMINSIGPQRYINSRDNGRSHVIAAIDPEIKNERIHGFAGPCSCDDVLNILREHFPDRRGGELLHKHYGKTWVGLEKTVMSNLKTLVQL